MGSGRITGSGGWGTLGAKKSREPRSGGHRVTPLHTIAKSGADGVTYRGRTGVRHRLEEWLESFDVYRYEVHRIIDCGGDEVLVEATEVGRGASSGAEVRSTHCALLTFRDGMVVRIREYYDKGKALEAAGLRG
jgi:ketosteroid isomerase-like protein